MIASLALVAIFARPLRHHEADERHRHDALPAERASGRDGGVEDPRIEQPRRRMRARRTGQDGAFAHSAPDEGADDGGDDGKKKKMPAMIRPAMTLS